MPPASARRLDLETATTLRAIGFPDAPVDGTLARSGEGEVVMLVDRALLEDWPAWELAGVEHVWAPLDVLRRPDGHAVVLPALQSGLDRLLARRTAASPLSDGERVTLAVSVLRGTAAALARGVAPTAPAAWWVTPDGEPLLVFSDDADAMQRASELALLTAADGARSEDLARALAAARDALAEPRTFARRADAVEDAVFAAAAPEPLVTTVLTAQRTRSAVAASEEPVVDAPERRSRERGTGGWWTPLARAGDRMLAAQAEDALARVRSAVRGGGRRLPLLVAAAAAVVVVAVGLAWPQGDAEPARADPPPASSSSAVAPSAEATAPAETDPVAATAALLAQRRSCPDGACWGQTQEDPADVLGGGAMDVESAEISLVDDFGGLAVLRVNAEGAAPRLVTVVTTPSGWLLRDAFDAAAEPG